MSFSFDVPDTDQVYVSHLPDDTTEEELAAHFGSIGVLKEDKKRGKPKIWLYRDKATGALKGDGTVSYVDPYSAKSAVDWFNGKDFKGTVITVSLAESKGQEGYGGRYQGGPNRPDSFGRVDQNPPEARGMGRGRGPPPAALPPPVLGPPPTPISLPPPPGGLGNSHQLPHPPASGPHMAHVQDSHNGYSGPQDFIAADPAEPQSHGQPDGSAFSDPTFDQQGAALPGPPSVAQRSGPPPPKELREGDWLCTGCGNTNFAFRGKCNRCQTPKPGSGPGGGRGRGERERGAEAGHGKVQAARQGPPGLFSEGDWTCTSCGNTNWARRQTCNLCNGPKPGTVDQNREGVGGGFKELDEAEVEEARRRRQQIDDRDMYDEFGRLKKKYRQGDRKAREEAALARLRGDPVPVSRPTHDVTYLSGGRREPAAESLPSIRLQADSGKERSRSRSPPKERKSRDAERDRERKRDRSQERRRR